MHDFILYNPGLLTFHSFGLSTQLAPTLSHHSKGFGGSHFYAAPEAAESGRITKASDVYSFGMITVELWK